MDYSAFYWPNGLQNLTDLGKLREFKIGRTLREEYKYYSNFTESEILALSSKVPRCRETIVEILKGITFKGIDSGQTEFGLAKEAAKYTIDHRLVPTLNAAILSKCLDSQRESRIASYKDYAKERIRNKYKGRSLNAIWSTIMSELELKHTPETSQLAEHYDWIHDSYNMGQMTQLDLLEASVAEDSLEDGRRFMLLIMPILSSILDSYDSVTQGVKNEYSSKKIVLYSTHDYLVINLLKSLNLLTYDTSSFEERFTRSQLKSSNDLDKVLDRLKMPAYGMSLKFELYESKSSSSSTEGKGKFYFIRLAIYNSASNVLYSDVDYQLIKFGDVCRKSLQNIYPSLSPDYIDTKFYENSGIDKRFNCPLELFRNITRKYKVSKREWIRLCSPDLNM